MLIESHRHTTADLRLWAELEEGDRALSRSPSLHENARRSMEEIRRFADAAPCYCSVSWGKDSVVLADLVMQVAPHVPLVWVRVEPICNPDCTAVRDAFLARHPGAAYHEFVTRCRWDGREWHARGTLEAGFAEAERVIGTRRHFSGLRADESGARRVSMRSRGLTAGDSCRPLGWWSVQDVFAWLASRNLPVHPAYAMLGGGRWPREHLRVASLGGRRGDQFGRTQWEREYYGDVLNRLARG